MEKLILPDKILNQQFCTECLNYLSVGPVMVSCDGKMICGRCSERVDSGLQQSLYNLIAENFLFKCINYHAGCRNLLRFNEALKHEEQCEKICLVCPFCNYEGNGCQLIRHFDDKHGYGHDTQEDNFKIVNEDKFLKNVVFVKNGCIFCVTIFVGGDEIHIYNLLIASDDTVSFSDFKLKFFDPDSNVETPPISVNKNRSQFISNSNLNNATRTTYPYSFKLARAMLVDFFPSGSCSCRIELIDKAVLPEDDYFTTVVEEIDRNISETRVKQPKREADFYIDYVSKMPASDLGKLISSKLYVVQHCVNCRKYVTTPVYFCPRYHMACQQCTVNKCSKCKTWCQWNCKSRLYNILLGCEWSDCIERTNIFDFISHKRDCKFRSYECLDRNCDFIGSLDCLKKH